MNEEKNLQNDEENLREVNPESITTDETLNNNTEKETSNGPGPLAIFGISFITSFIVNMLLSFIFVPTMIDNIAEDLVKASAKSIIEETSNDDKDSESSKKEDEKTFISSTIAYKYNDKTVEIFSPVSCYINFELNVSSDSSSLSTNKYGPIELIAGEKKTLSLDDLSDYPEDAKIKFLSITSKFVYGDSPLDSSLYSLSKSNIGFNCYMDGVKITTTEDTLASFSVIIKDGDFIGFIDTELLPIYTNSTNIFMINDLAPNFFSDEAKINTYSFFSIDSYEEKDN